MIYRSLGVAPIINAAGPATRPSGGPLHPEVAAAVTPRSAAILWVAQPWSEPARQAGLPLPVDAAAQLPPAANLRRFLAERADLVCFSGGKAIGGPQASGILAGRRDLVCSALLQMLDLDLPDRQFALPAARSRTARCRRCSSARAMPAPPRRRCGR